jgi:hypothetical protein
MKNIIFQEMTPCSLLKFTDVSRLILDGSLFGRKRWAGHVARMGENRNVYRILVGKPEGKRPLRRPRHRWVDNIKIYLIEIGWRLYGLD